MGISSPFRFAVAVLAVVYTAGACTLLTGVDELAERPHDAGGASEDASVPESSSSEVDGSSIEDAASEDAATEDAATEDADAAPATCTETPCVVAIAAAAATTCALTEVGGVRCWGDNDDGAVGTATKGPVPTPTAVSFDGPVDEIGLGDWGTGDTTACARRGSVVDCWGSDGNRRLGRNVSAGSFVPVPAPVVGVATAAGNVGVGSQLACVIVADGGLSCWGKTYDDVLHGTAQSFAAPRPVVRIVGGRAHHCALLDSGEVACAGWPLYSRDHWNAGNGPGQATLEIVSGVTGISELASLGNFHCALKKSDGAVLCWGRNGRGQLGRGTTSQESLVPAPVPLPRAAKSIGAGMQHACAILTDESVWCWGRNGGGGIRHSGTNGVTTLYGQAGAAADGGVDELTATPRKIEGLPSGVVRAVAGGYEHTCALMESGAVYCWGSNRSGQLGRGKAGMTPDLLPHPVAAKVLF